MGLGYSLGPRPLKTSRRPERPVEVKKSSREYESLLQRVPAIDEELVGACDVG